MAISNRDADDVASRPVGPKLETYIETRLNLLTVNIDRADEALAATIGRVEDGLLVRVKHLHDLNDVTDELSKRAIDKAEAAQAAHNAAGNEWRRDFNDLKGTLATRTEFDRFYAEFSAYRLESSRMASREVGTQAGNKQNRDNIVSLVALGVAAAAVLVAFFKS